MLFWVLWTTFIYWILIPYWLYHLQIFSPIVSCFFLLSMVSFAVQKVLSLIRSHLFIVAFFPFVLRDRSKKILLWFTSNSVLPMISPKSFMVYDLTFSSLMYFVYFFMLLENVLISFFSAVQFSQHHLLKRLFFSLV